MGLFSREKCPVHRIEYSVDKDYMCQPYLFCKKCRQEKQNAKKLEGRVKELERRLNIEG